MSIIIACALAGISMSASPLSYIKFQIEFHAILNIFISNSKSLKISYQPETHKNGNILFISITISHFKSTTVNCLRLVSSDSLHYRRGESVRILAQEF